MLLIVGISGASGVVMGYQMLKVLKQIPDIEVHLDRIECGHGSQFSRHAWT